MDRIRWERIQSTFDTLVELEDAERRNRLTAIGSTDPELRAAVESLLAADSDADSQLAPLEGVLLRQPVPAPDPLGLAGRTISHFQIRDPIGAGGMGVVYRADDTRLGRAVALKFLLPSYGLDARAKPRLLREARAVAALDHPNVCTIYEVGESEDGRLFLAMALYPGETLKARLVRKGSLGVGEALAVTRQILAGLRCAHAAGIVHGDLKPGNMMVLPDDTVKILDFGLARARDESLSGASAGFGTVAYMAPEQVRGETVDASADLWAVGVVLYEMLTGCKPFRAVHEVAFAHAILYAEPAPPSALNAGVPAAVDEIALTLLQKDKTRRFANAAAALDAVANGGLIDEPPRRQRISSKLFERTYARVRARPMLATLGLIVLAGVGTVAGTRLAHSIGNAPASPTADRVAVLPFDNLSRDTADKALGRITADLISQQLSSAGAIKVVPTLDVIRSTEAAAAQASRAKKDAFRAQAQELGVGTLVHGSYYRRGDTLGFQAYLFDAQRGTIEAGVPGVEGSADDPMKVIGQIAERVSGAVAAKLDLKLDLSLVPPPTFAAYRLFIDGHHEQLRNNFGGALDLFLRAAASDTTFKTALYFAAAQAGVLNRWSLVDSLVRVIEKSSMQVPLFDRIQLGYFQARLRGDEGGALAVQRELARLAPGTHFEFMVSYLALRNNRPREAARVARGLDPERGFLRGWFWYWPILTASYHLMGDHRQELRDARAAVDRYPEFFPLARALEIRALTVDPTMPDIVRWFDSLPAPPQRQEFVRGYLLEIAASELVAHGRSEAGKNVYRQAVASYESALRTQPDEENAFNLVRSLFALRRYDEALRHATELRARFPRKVDYLGLVGTIEAASGRKAEAEEITRRLKAWNEPYLFGRPSYWLAAIAAQSRDLDSGLEALTRAFSQGMPLWGYPNTPDFGDTHADVFLEPLREHPAFARLVRLRG